MAFPPWITFRELGIIRAKNLLSEIERKKPSYNFALDFDKASYDFVIYSFMYSPKRIGRHFFPAYCHVNVVEITIPTVQSEASYIEEMLFLDKILKMLYKELNYKDKFFEEGGQNVLHPVPFVETYSTSNIKAYTKTHYDSLRKKWQDLGSVYTTTYEETGLGAIISYKHKHFNGKVAIVNKFHVTSTRGTGDVNTMLTYMLRLISKFKSKYE